MTKTKWVLLLGIGLIVGGVVEQQIYIPPVGFVVFLIGIGMVRHQDKKKMH